MTLHHIKDVAVVLGRLHAALKPGGWLAAADWIRMAELSPRSDGSSIRI